jgi:hypothetical protein
MEKGGSTQSPTAPIDVFHRCLAVLALEKDERDKESATSANSSPVDTLTRKAVSYNAQMATLVTELMSSYDTAAVSERHRVFPFVLSSISKILSRKFPTASPLQSSDVSNSSALILAVISCFHSSLRGLTTVNLCPSLSKAATAGDSDERKESDEAEAADESVNENIFENENDGKTNAPKKNQNNQSIDQNDADESEEEENASTSFPFYSHNQSSDVAEGIVLYLANQMVISKIIFLLTVCLESLKATEMKNSKTNTAQSRSIVSIRSGNRSSSSKRSTGDCQTSENSKNCDDIYPLKKHLNADDDAIIVQIFSSLRIAQVFEALSDDHEKNKIKTTPEGNEDGAKKEKKDKMEKEEKEKESAFLKPFSGVFLAQFVQFSLFFSVHRYTDSSVQ